MLLAWLLAGCTQSADDVRARHEATAAHPATPSARPTVAAKPAAPNDADYVAAVAVNKLNLPLSVRFRLDGQPRVGQPAKIDLLVTPAAQAQIRSLRFRFEAGEGLQYQGEPDFVVDGAAPGIAVHRELLVVPRVAGLLELQARAALETSSEAVSQTYAIPLIAVADTP